MGIEHATPAIVVVVTLLFYVLFRSMRRAESGEQLYVRRIAGVDAIDQAIGRSAELGRPISFSTGLTSLGPVLYALLGVLHHVAQKASIYRSKLFIPQCDIQTMVVTEDTVREAYRSQGKAHEFDPNNILFLSDEQFAFASGYMGMIHREKVASTFLFGRFAAESLMLAEAGQQIGAMQVAATVNPEQVPFFISTCDYTIIGEELFASSAYLTREPVQLGSLYAQDRVKLGLLILIIFGVVWSSCVVAWPELERYSIDNIIRTPWGALFELGGA